MKYLFLVLIFIVFKANAQVAKPAPEIKLYAFDCGTIYFANFSGFSDTGAYDNKSAHLVDPCFLISHPKGYLLWDTGLSDAFVDHPKNTGGMEIRKTTLIKNQLQKIGLNIGDINFVSISHSHLDHAGNLNLFSKSTWIIQKEELPYSSHVSSPFVMAPAKMTNWKKVKKQLIDGDYDVFGDGSVNILKTPGHTPGHQSLEIKLPQSGIIILSGDEYHQKTSVEPLQVPSFNWNRADTMASSDRIKTIIKNANARLIVQHDEADFNSLPKFPEYLK